MDRDTIHPSGDKLTVAPGATVYDMNGDKIGTVQEYNPQADCLVVEKGFIFTRDVYIPGSAIERSDANGIRVALSKDELKADRYTQPPTPGTNDNHEFGEQDWP